MRSLLNTASKNFLRIYFFKRKKRTATGEFYLLAAYSENCGTRGVAMAVAAVVVNTKMAYN